MKAALVLKCCALVALSEFAAAEPETKEPVSFSASQQLLRQELLAAADPRSLGALPRGLAEPEPESEPASESGGSGKGSGSGVNGAAGQSCVLLPVALVAAALPHQ